MSSENEVQFSLQSPMESSATLSDQKKQRIRYTREFFLSLSELDVCKKLPTGLDKSILIDLEEANNNASERQRSFYRTENSSRWEIDLQSDRESLTQDSGRRFGNQNRRTWQDPEHDGLLGSGALARPPGFAGASTPKARGNGQYQLSRSTEPYQPPRPYKASPYPRKDGSDLCNDETFGSSECSNVDREEEERKRRESFELMRKEQKKTLQVKNNDNHKGNLDVDIMALLDNSDADKSTKSRSKTDESTADSPSCDLSKSSSLIHVPAARPLVPPGFASTLMEKNNQVNKLMGMELYSVEKNKSPSSPSSFVPDVGFFNISFNPSVLQEANEVWEEDVPNESFCKKEAGPDRVDAAIQDHSASIFDKLFENAFVKNSGSLASDSQNHVNKADEKAWNHVTSESSKFAHLFHEESECQLTENMPIEDKSSRDLLSLIVNKDNFGLRVYMSSNDENTEKNQSSLPSEDAAGLNTSLAPSPITGMFLESYRGDEQRPCAVLTCEDLEQSILAEVKDRCSVMQSLQEPLTSVDAKSEELKGVVDDHASHHLLSLLQRGANSKESLESPRLDGIGSHDMHASSDVESSLHFQLTDNSGINLCETENSSEKHVTLEALFGAAFMNELHSMEAPVSDQKILVGTVNDTGAIGSYGLPFYSPDSLTSIPNGLHSKKVVLEGEILQLSNSTEHTRVHKIPENWAGYRDSSLHGFKVGDLASEQAAGGLHLPEEDSLISLSDSLDTVASDSLCFQKVTRNEPLVTGRMGGNSDQLLHAILRVGEPSREPSVDYSALMHTSHEMADPGGDYRHVPIRPTLQFPHQMNHGKPLFAAPSDHPTLKNSQMNFLSPDVMRLDPHHPFAQNVFAHHSYNSSSSPHFDPNTRHHMLQPMPFSGNFPSHNSVQGLPRVPHPINHIAGLSHEMNNPHMFPQHHRQPNYGGRGIGMPGHGIGGAATGRRSQEAFERLMEMEMRANSKQFHPSMPDHVPGIYGPEVDMNLHYM